MEILPFYNSSYPFVAFAILQSAGCAARDWCDDTRTAASIEAVPAWTKTLPHGESVVGLTVDKSGRTTVTGRGFGAKRDNALFAAAFDENGKPLWNRTFAGSDTQGGNAIGEDENGNVVIAVHIRGTIDTGIGSMGADTRTEELAVVSLDPAGATRWAKVWAPVSVFGPASIAVTASGRSFVTADGNGARIGDASMNGGFVVSIEPTGELAWTLPLGPRTTDTHVALGPNESVEVSWTDRTKNASFIGTVDDKGHLVDVHPIPSHAVGASDVAIDKEGNAVLLFPIGTFESSLTAMDRTGTVLFSENTRAGWSVDEVIADPHRGWLVSGIAIGQVDACGQRHVTKQQAGFIAELDPQGHFMRAKWLSRSLGIDEMGLASDGSVVVAGFQEKRRSESAFLDAIGSHTDSRWLGFSTPPHPTIQLCQLIDLPESESFVAKLKP